MVRKNRSIIIKKIINYLKDVYNNKYLLSVLIERDIKQRFVGSAFGLFWAFLQPFISVLVLWTVITFGFKGQSGPEEIPFIVYLSIGMMVWNIFSETWVNGTNSIIEYSFVIKKTSFRSSLLPFVKIISTSIINMFFVFLVIILIIAYGFYPSIYWLQFFYYFICLVALSLVLNFITSSTNVFLLDISQLVKIFLNFGFWLTPIFWKIEFLPEKYRIFVNFNPMYYVVNGFRETFLYKKFFWENPYTLYFWAFVFIIGLIGVKIFKSLRPYFTDVL
ncbi:MAG TPA: ABC transporter permease [Spirochaetota bacterium]|nr:ABC transporter permease [Spirochaetota bacterium]HOM38785.1 ABC transporter permease [Spirochaetota bacterium]HPQ49843.1 ABC transporter permease [Spirochaetota bacterium]